MSKSFRRAFTLVELLVVVAIIVVLISILLPAMEEAFDYARTAACQSNFKNLGTATRLYLNDASGTFMNHRAAGDSGANDGDGVIAPGSTVRETDGTKEKWWATDLFKYGLVSESFHCHALKGAGRTDYGVTWQWAFTQDLVGYGYNTYFLGKYPYNWSDFWLPASSSYWVDSNMKISKVVQPSNNLCFGETQPARGGDGQLYWSQSLWWWNSSMSNTGFNEGVTVNRHGKGSVVSFSDAHVEVRRAEEINPTGPVEGHPYSAKYWDPKQLGKWW